MSTQIMNGGIEGAILRIVKDDYNTLTPEQEERLELLESLPKNVWVDLDDSGNPISKEQAENNMKEELSHFKIINHVD
jgi:hypothetical protein